MDRIEEEEKKARRHTEDNDREIEELEKSRNEAGTVTQTNWSICCFQT